MKSPAFAAVLVALALLLPASAMSQTCPPGQYGPGGQEPCDDCAAGYFSPSAGASQCTACPPGSFSLPGSSTCAVCGPGTFAPSFGSASCLSCPPGTFSPGVGAAQCQVCPQGTIAATPQSASCTPCPPGYTSNPDRTECVEIATRSQRYGWGRLKMLYR